MAKKATSSKSWDRFQITFQRAKSLEALYRRLLRVRLKKTPSSFKHNDVADLLRSALVLAVAAMDSYFTARFAELLVPYLKKNGPSDDLVSLLKDAGLDTRQALEMIKMNRPYRRVRKLMDAYLDRYTTQRAEVIDRLFRSYGLKNFSSHAQGLKKRRNLVRRMELVVERRHEIVHEGDLNDHGRIRKIDPEAVRSYLKDIELFVQGADELTTRRMK